ncbi:hypothetical protein [Pseudovibrio sp. Tun.PSC04-5.I4]|uniref:hypothetical protein n=1 Tax=Pseudovibrio sp. Tun.PSC04-5.I4 TaxID=1798213 RepID=UPI000B8205C6|nr:hypothetical protein [Pseudovibrio sp. Tun.PSC04-5.I4]
MIAGLNQTLADLSRDENSYSYDYSRAVFQAGAVIEGSYDFGWAVFSPNAQLSHAHGTGETVAYDIDGEEQNNKLKFEAVDLTRLQLQPTLAFSLVPSFIPGEALNITASPRFACERIQSARISTQCGGGAELSFAQSFAANQGFLKLKASYENLGDNDRSLLQFNAALRF